jgi:hypothetical protein
MKYVPLDFLPRFLAKNRRTTLSLSVVEALRSLLLEAIDPLIDGRMRHLVQVCDLRRGIVPSR